MQEYFILESKNKYPRPIRVADRLQPSGQVTDEKKKIYVASCLLGLQLTEN